MADDGSLTAGLLPESGSIGEKSPLHHGLGANKQLHWLCRLTGVEVRKPLFIDGSNNPVEQLRSAYGPAV